MDSDQLRARDWVWTGVPSMQEVNNINYVFQLFFAKQQHNLLRDSQHALNLYTRDHESFAETITLNTFQKKS